LHGILEIPFAKKYSAMNRMEYREEGANENRIWTGCERMERAR
jgi:hypothetical protein